MRVRDAMLHPPTNLIQGRAGGRAGGRTQGLGLHLDFAACVGSESRGCCCRGKRPVLCSGGLEDGAEEEVARNEPQVEAALR